MREPFFSKGLQIFSKGLQTLWCKKAHGLWALIPLSWLFMLITALRRILYQTGVLTQTRFNIPVIVIGNLSLGGSGKTPLVLYIAHMLQDRGLKVGIVSRGYKGSHQKPTGVGAESDPLVVGDEPLMIYQHLRCPLVVAKDRVAALQHLLAGHTVDVVLSDDGLQHYALGRSIEIVVMPVDLANRYCLPAGPLREPLSRLKTVDLIVYNTSKVPMYSTTEYSLEITHKGKSYDMQYQADLLYKAVDATQRQALEIFKGMKVHAVAGLGNPTVFFHMLQTAGLEVIPHIYADHHAYQASDILFGDQNPVILTEKDFVKCTGFVQNEHWVLPIHAVLSEGFDQALWTLIQAKIQ